MYAYVKFIDGAKQGHKKIVNADSINYKFDKDLKFNNRGTYTITYDGSEQRAQIIFLKRTQNEINELVRSNKRVKVLSQKQLESESEKETAATKLDESSISQKRSVKSKVQNERKTNVPVIIKASSSRAVKRPAEKKDKEEKRISKFAKLINIKTENLKSIVLSQSKLDQDNNVSKSAQNKLQESNKNFDEGTMVDKRQEVDDLTIAQDSQTSTAKNAADQPTDCKNNKVISAKEDVLEKTSNNSQLESGNNDDVVLSEETKQKLDAAVLDKSYATLEATDTIKSKPKIKSDEPVHMHFACKQQQQEFLKTIKEKEAKIQKLKDENEKKQKQLHDLKKENTRLKKKNNGLIDECDKANKIALTKETLNEQLQRVIIDKFFEQNTIKDQLKDFEKDLEIDDTKNYLPVGSHRQSDNTIHIGRNQRLPAEIYNTIMRSKKPGSCVGHALLAVFGESTLLRSTLTGNISNRTKGIMKGKTGKRGKKGKADKKEKDAEEEDNVSEVEDDLQIETNKENKNEIIPQCEKLDGVKLAACEDLFVHYVRTIYGKKKGVTDANIQVELSSFNEYVSKQISYLKRERRKIKTVEKGADETLSLVEEVPEQLGEAKQERTKTKIVGKDDETSLSEEVPDKETENTYASIMLEEAASSSMSNSSRLLSMQTIDPLAIECQEKEDADFKDHALDDTPDVMDDISSDYSSVHLDDTCQDDLSASDTEDL